MSPIADLTVLTRVSTRCDYNSHLKTCSVCNNYNYNHYKILIYTPLHPSFSYTY